MVPILLELLCFLIVPIKSRDNWIALSFAPVPHNALMMVRKQCVNVWSIRPISCHGSNSGPALTVDDSDELCVDS